MTRSCSRFSAVPHPGVSLFRRFCDTKTLGWQNLVFWAQNQQRTHHKVGTTRPPKAIHTAIYAEGACPYTHRATDNRHTECAGLPWWSFGSRRARIVCKGSPIRFVPSVCYKISNIVVGGCGCFGATFEARGAEPTRGIYNLRILFPPVPTRVPIVMRYLGVGNPSS